MYATAQREDGEVLILRLPLASRYRRILLVSAAAPTLRLRISPLPPCLVCSADLLLVDLKSVSVLHVELLEVDVSFAVTPRSVEGDLEVFIRELY
jgi:hypothetical protein